MAEETIIFPDWARYMAQDAGGRWYFYLHEPKPSRCAWVPRGRSKYIKQTECNPTGWRDTLLAKQREKQ